MFDGIKGCAAVGANGRFVRVIFNGRAAIRANAFKKRSVCFFILIKRQLFAVEQKTGYITFFKTLKYVGFNDAGVFPGLNGDLFDIVNVVVVNGFCGVFQR